MNMFEKIYTTVRSIPPGKVMSYGSVAQTLGNPRLARVVGWALHQNPDPATIPCHRVVRRDGSLSESFAFGGAQEHAHRLRAEGIYSQSYK